MGTNVQIILSPTTGITNARYKRWFLVFCTLCLFFFASPLAAAPAPRNRGFANPVREKQAQDKQVYQLVVEFMTDIRKGSTVKAYQTLTSADFRENTPLNAFITFVTKYATLRRNRGIELEGIQYHDNIGVVDITLTSLEHDTNRAQFILRYEEGRWRVISIQVSPSKPVTSEGDKL